MLLFKLAEKFEKLRLVFTADSLAVVFDVYFYVLDAFHLHDLTADFNKASRSGEL